ncbi:copper resistance D family protein [Litchfieldia alkalitelluris]|uniref:copper resistance D family protein n=1 Tax=Litchfieldia alkalitelluris TaxID=304268 RepID=UPI001F402D10|nr:CopD family protein [Litchfieldia alkalitelluris]
MISWFSTSKENWLTFLKWFTPVAITCFLITIGTGLFLMTLVVDFKDYTDAWMLSYGQALLIKHLLIIPLLAFAFINSVLMRKRLSKDKEFNPKPWIKAESIILLFIFSATAALGQQSPPHDIETALATSGPARLFDLLYQGQIERGLNVVLSFNSISNSLLGLAVLFLAMTILSFVKKAPTAISFIMSIFMVLTFYLAIMLSVILN